MNPFEMVALIVTLGVTGSVIKHYIDARNESASRKMDGGDSRLADQLQNIEKRLQVLERIVTSDGYDLKQQFKNLDEENKGHL